MKTMAMWLAMAGAAFAQAKTVRPQEPPAYDRPSLKKGKAAGGTKVDVEAGTELGWDDNILDLNDHNVDQLEGTAPAGKFDIDDPADFVYSAWVELKVTGKLLLADPASAGISIQPYFYASNSIANYEEYSLFARQPVGPHQAGIEYDLERDVYYRNLDTGPQEWTQAFYDEHEVELYWKHALPKGWTLRPTAGWRFRNYNSTFDHRDRDGGYLGIEGAVAFAKGWRAFLSYEWSDLDADATAADNDDTSYRQHGVELGAEWEAIEKKLDLALKWRVQLRDFTSTDPQDSSHLDREDVRNRVVIEARWKLAKGWAAQFSWEWRVVNSTQPFDTDPLDPDGGDTHRNVVMLGVSVSL